jgi:hypothetical protein
VVTIQAKIRLVCVGGVCRLAVVLTVFLIFKHLKYYTVPSHQVLIIRIVLMVRE